MRTITFYSYKGGVGRTLALANMVNRLGEFNKKICLLDFDLEAPGLQYKFLLSRHAQPITKGIVDYIHEYYVNGSLPVSIKDFSISFPTLPSAQPVNFIPAGNTNSSEYWKKLSAINWYDLLYENENGIAFFLDLKEKIRKEFNPDFLLIDSRTGITETAGVTMSILADEVVVVSANNTENLEGSRKIINSLSNKESSVLGKVPKITFVLSRIPFTEKDAEKEDNLVRYIKASFDPEIIKEINVIHSDRELEERESLKIGYDNEDKTTSQVSRDYLKLFEKIFNDDLSLDEVKKFKDIKLAERLFAKAVKEENIENQIKYIDEAIGLDPKRNYYLQKGYFYNNSEKYKEAIEMGEKVIEIDQKFIGGYFLLGDCYFKLDKYEDALKVYNEALKIDPQNSNLNQYIGAVHNELNDQANAILFYTKAIELNPTNAAAYNGRAHTYRLLRDAEKALSNVYKSIELDSYNPISYATLAEINAMLNKENEFYINIERALDLADNKETNSTSTDVKWLEKAIKEDAIYKPFYKNERFHKILDRYDIILLDEDDFSGD